MERTKEGEHSATTCQKPVTGYISYFKWPSSFVCYSNYVLGLISIQFLAPQNVQNLRITYSISALETGWAGSGLK
jgi:hypothetical protein